MNVGWIGTGKLGLPMAARIAASGTGVRVYVRSPDRVEAIRARQVVCVTFDEMAAQNIVFSSLPDDIALRQVAEELVPALRPGGALVETSTVSPSVSAEIGKELAARGIADQAPAAGRAHRSSTDPSRTYPKATPPIIDIKPVIDREVDD
jgi:3-hydroxyisobutyrate dehydrogenase-like beta-hydroxyacid dehydrogenase